MWNNYYQEGDLVKMQKIFWVFLVFFALSISVFAEDESEIITTEELTPAYINSIIKDTKSKKYLLIY